MRSANVSSSPTLADAADAPGFVGRARRALNPWTGVAVVAGAAVALLAAVLMVPPSRDDLRESANALVPPGAEVTERGENLGSELIAGQYFVSVRFTTDASGAQELYRRSRTHAESLGWTAIQVQDRPNGSETWFTNDRQLAELTIIADDLTGGLQVREDRAASRRAILAITLATPLAVFLGAVLVATVSGRRPNRVAD